MRRNHGSLAAWALAAALAGTAAGALGAREEAIAFEVTQPERQGAEVGKTVILEGTASLPAGYHLWIFARRADFEPMWWPQGPGIVDPKTGKWRGQATLGKPQDVGWTFDISVAVFGEEEHMKLLAYRGKSMSTGVWRPIDMPEAAAAPKHLRVKKLSDDT